MQRVEVKVKKDHAQMKQVVVRNPHMGRILIELVIDKCGKVRCAF